MASMFVSGLSTRKVQTRSFTMRNSKDEVEEELPSTHVGNEWTATTPSGRAKRNARHREWAAATTTRAAARAAETDIRFTGLHIGIGAKSLPSPQPKKLDSGGPRGTARNPRRLVEALVDVKVRKSSLVVSPQVGLVARGTRLMVLETANTPEGGERMCVAMIHGTEPLGWVTARRQVNLAAALDGARTLLHAPTIHRTC